MSGDGVDLAAVYRLLSEVARKGGEHDRRFDQIDRRLGDMSAEIAGLRDAVTNYHSSVLGHGILISELEERVRRIERQSSIPPASEQPVPRLKEAPAL